MFVQVLLLETKKMLSDRLGQIDHSPPVPKRSAEEPYVNPNPLSFHLTVSVILLLPFLSFFFFSFFLSFFLF